MLFLKQVYLDLRIIKQKNKTNTRIYTNITSSPCDQRVLYSKVIIYIMIP